MDYACSIRGLSNVEGKVDLMLEVVVPISSVCPCSKEISEVGAHNQRGTVTVLTRLRGMLWTEERVEIVDG